MQGKSPSRREPKGSIVVKSVKPFRTKLLTLTDIGMPFCLIGRQLNMYCPVADMGLGAWGEGGWGITHFVLNVKWMGL